MRIAGLVLRQLRYTNRAFWRNPAAAFFTIAFPLMFLVIFTTLFGRGRLDINGNLVSPATFYIPAIAVFSAISACYSNVAMSLIVARERGVLKRIKATPLPGGAYLASRILHAVLIALVLVAICAIFGALFYDAALPVRSLPAFIVTLSVGSACFCALGTAVTTIVPNADAAPAIVNATFLPLLFVSDIFIPLQDPAPWVAFIGDVFPFKHFSTAMQHAFFPADGSLGFTPASLAVMGAWGLGGLLVAVRRFTWEPKR